MKRTLPLKYSTNLTTEAKGQRVGLLPSEGESGRRAHTVSGCGTLPTGVWMQPQHQEWGGGRRGDGTALSTSPWTPEPQQRRSSLSLARVRGIRKKSEMESKETYFFFRSWEQRGQNLKSDKEEQGKPKVSEACVHSSAQLWDSLSSSCHGSVTYHFPRGLVVSPTQAKWNHSMEHWKRQMEHSGQGPEQGGGERSHLKTPKRSPSFQPFRNFPQVSRQPSPTTVPFCSPSLQWNHLLLLFLPSRPSELLPQS